jgi:hypothetical protein
MILHIAVFTWNDDVTDADVDALTEALQTMAAGIPELKSYIAGTNLRLRPGGDYGVAAVVEDEAALATYLDSAAHQQVYDDHLGKMIATRIAAQLPITEGTLV